MMLMMILMLMMPTTTIMNRDNAFGHHGDDDADVDNHGDYADLSHIGDIDYCTN